MIYKKGRYIMQTPPLVSILTPSFNQARWLGVNLESVANQTYSPIEHIVMDGGSTDGSVRILESATHNLIWHSGPDQGQSDALNKAFDRSSGEIVGWINSDDAYVDVRAISSVVAMFEEHPDVDVIFGHALLVDADSHVLRSLWAGPFVPRMLNHVTPFVQPSVFFRRTAIHPPLVNEQLHYVMDKDLWLRLSGSHRFKRIKMIVAMDRHQPNRKVLSSGYPEELNRYNSLREFNSDSLVHHAVQRSYQLVSRIAGAVLVTRDLKALQLALPLRLDSPSKTLWRQLFRRRPNIAAK